MSEDSNTYYIIRCDRCGESREWDHNTGRPKGWGKIYLADTQTHRLRPSDRSLPLMDLCVECLADMNHAITAIPLDLTPTGDE